MFLQLNKLDVLIIFFFGVYVLIFLQWYTHIVLVTNCSNDPAPAIHIFFFISAVSCSTSYLLSDLTIPGLYSFVSLEVSSAFLDR